MTKNDISHFCQFSDCTFFLMGRWRIRMFFNKDQISSGEGKRKGKRGYGGESLNEGYYCKIPIIKHDTNFISQTFGQTNFKPPPLQWHTQKPICRDFQVILSSSSWLKTICILWKNKYGFHIVCFKKTVEPAHIPELKRLKTYSWKLKMVHWKLKTVYWKLMMYSWKLKMVGLLWESQG